jgi:hypothetical protein
MQRTNAPMRDGYYDWKADLQPLMIWFFNESKMSDHPQWMLEHVPMPFMPVICED